ncbi:sugar ABC transporter ATP-binding protein [Pseudotabrizicola sp. 4114]|uniref:sugar ABC transporter ATP-binding protein n=1 Tax=Pseudotabrizicola sp. 4114 TaxID=2817731 RepID=UPI00285AFAC2|nr:ribose transport system ATP-binding protein [Pseudorhodobacter sp. 4114]
MTPVIQLTGIHKRFGVVPALSGVDLHVSQGEVLGLVGENGAGKSTLMRVIGGVYVPDSGRIVLDGVEVDRLSVQRSMAARIAFVHQELSNFDNLTVAENIFLGRMPTRFGPLRLVDTKTMNRHADVLLARLGATFTGDTPLARLSLAQMQLAEIAKALSLQARLIIMDEPTSSLTATETDRLLSVIEALRGDGVAIIFITHRLGEIERLADRVTVLRDGHHVADLDRSDIRAPVMIRHMIGRDLKALYRPPAAPSGPPLLQISGLRTPRYPACAVDLTLHRGEILGLAGLIGAGRTELAETIFGLTPALAGQVMLEGQPLTITTPRQAIARGIFLVPEDRKQNGLILDFPISQNISLPSLRALSRYGIVNHTAEAGLAGRQKKALDLRAANLTLPASALSGGNQQKVVLARWLALSPRVILFDEPTRGVDVGAKAEIYRLMRALADQGVGVLMISSDMEEVIGVADRVLVMHEGRIAGALTRAGLSEHAILSLAVGHDTAVKTTEETAEETTEKTA